MFSRPFDWSLIIGCMLVIIACLLFACAELAA
jgi:hypothetical protein